MVLSLDAHLVAEIAHLEGRADGVVFDEQQIVAEKRRVVPDKVVIERLPVDAEEDDDECEQESEIFSLA